MVFVFIEHEVAQVSSKQRAPRALPKPLPGNRQFDTLIPQWHADFLKRQVMQGKEKEMGSLQELLSCASFLGVKGLARLASGKIASLMQACRSVDQLRELIGIENDFPPEVVRML